jgi:glycosyltransferase involved in cell wall biosynthesis
MKQITFVFCNDKIGGAENVMMLLAEQYSKQGFEVNIVCLQCEQTNRLAVFKNVQYMPTKNKFWGCILFILKNNVKANSILFSSQIHINGLLACSKPFFFNSVKLILRESTQIFTRFSGIKKTLHSIPYYFYKNASLVIAQTETMKDSIIHNFSKAANWHFATIPNPINTNLFAAKKQAYAIEEKFKNAIVTVGRLIPIKGFDILIDAYSQSEILQQTKLLIIGNGPEKENLQSIINSKNLQNSIFLLGEINNPFPYLTYAKVCVVSSILEGFPNVILEMMYCSNNIVSTNCAGGISDLKGISVCEPNSSKAMQIALELNHAKQHSELILNTDSFKQELDKREISNFINQISSLIA